MTAELPDGSAAEPIIFCENLVKIYKSADIEVVALQGLDIAISAGEVMGIIGNSGSGKTTLLNIIGGLDRPSAGKVLVEGRELLKFTDSQLVEYRRRTVGFVWQNNARNLIPYLSAQENVEIPMLLNGTAARRERAGELLSLVGLSHRRSGRLAELSGGEQQRVAIAIGLANRPRILLADEPTGEVDSKTAMLLLDVFRQASQTFGVTVIIVTHDDRVSRKVDRVVAIRDGRTSSELIRRRSYAEELRDMASDGAEGTEEATHEELAVVDKAGRLQVPRDYLDALGVKGQGKVEMDGDRIVLKRPRSGEKAGG
jgi:ABC-type lipoprotein export system ATPase subunit